MRNQKTSPHKLAFVLLILIAALAVSGCVRQVAPVVVPTEVDTSQIEEILTATPSPP